MVDSIRDRPVFLCGHPKSGASLVRALLDWHPELVVYPKESGFSVTVGEFDRKVCLATEIK